MNRKNIIITLILVFLLASVKINSLPLVLLLVFIKPAQFSNSKNRWFFWIGVFILFVFIVFAWNFVGLKQTISPPTSENDKSVIDTIFYTLKTPFVLISGLFNYLARYFSSAMSSWIAVYGYGYWAVPGVVLILFLGALLLAGLYDFKNKKMPLPIRFGLLGLFLLMYLGTFFLRYFPSQVMGGNATIQGRYITTTMPLLFLGLTAWGCKLTLSKWIIRLAISLLVISLGSYLVGMGLSYYQLCGVNSYTGKDCMLPVYKNWGPSKGDMVLLPQKGIIQQSIVPDCDKIDRIRVETFIFGEGTLDETFSISLVDLENDQTVTEQELSIDQVKADGFIQIDFPPYEHIVNRELIIQLIGLSIDGQSLGFPVSDPGEYRGSFSVNGKVVEKDLLFHYRCVK